MLKGVYSRICRVREDIRAMYSLLSGLYRYMTLKEEYNILILGLDNAGKTVSIKNWGSNLF